VFCARKRLNLCCTVDLCEPLVSGGGEGGGGGGGGGSGEGRAVQVDTSRPVLKAPVSKKFETIINCFQMLLLNSTCAAARRRGRGRRRMWRLR